MAYTVTDYDRLRKAIDASPATLNNIEAADIFAEAATLYAGVGSIRAGTRVIAIGNILASAAKLVSYSQDTTTESMSDVFEHLHKLLLFWTDERDKALADEEETANAASAQSIRIPVIASW